MKNSLRTKTLEKRTSLKKEFVIRRSFEILKRLEALKEFVMAENIMVYVPVRNEVDVLPLIKEFLHGKKKRIVVPYMCDDDIKISRLKDISDLESGHFCIPEPKPDKIICFPKEKIDIVLIPAIVFDKSGYRVGYGKGCYDRFLKDLRALKVGLAYDFQIVDNVPKESHDIPVDVIITEEQVIRVQKHRECFHKG